MFEWATSGMDVAHVRRFAKQMDSEASDIDTLISTLTSEVDHIDWRGADRERFVAKWRDTHVKALHRVSDGMRTASKQAYEYAARQEAASRA